jgi:GNAT superfamily N-acetyltransferase
MSAAHGSVGLTSRQDYFGDPAAWAALVALLHDTFGIDVSIQDRFGGPDPTSMPFAYFDANGTCVANFSAFSMPMMIDGRLVAAAGFQSGAVRPEWRGRGLYRDLMRRAFAWCDAQSFELGLLLTDKPALYEPYGFKNVPQYQFSGPPPVAAKSTGTSRMLSLDKFADAALVKRLLHERTPVSSIFAVAAQAEMFLLNSCFDPGIRLSYLDQPEVVVAWKSGEADCFRLLDVAGKMIPPLSVILAALDQRPSRVEVCLPPDLLDWQGTPGPFPSYTSLMVRGDAANRLREPVMLSPMAEFRRLFPAMERRQPALHRRRLDDRRIGLRAFGDAVEDRVELLHVPHQELGDEAVVARHLVAFDEFRRFLDQLLDDMQHARHRPHAYDSLQGVTECRRIDADGEARDHTAVLQPPQPVRRAGRGEACFLRQLLQKDAPIGRQNVEKAAVEIIKHGVLRRRNSMFAFHD